MDLRVGQLELYFVVNILTPPDKDSGEQYPGLMGPHVIKNRATLLL